MAAALLISDLHLTGERPAIVERFFEFLAEPAARASALYVLGDLFEYWIGDDELDPEAGDPLARRVAEGFAALARSGVPVALMHGNRDFLIGPRFCAASAARLLPDPTVEKIAGVRTLLMHGDTLCTDDLDYQAWRRQTRAPGWQRDFLARSIEARRQLLQAIREKSKEVVSSKPADIMDVNDGAVRQALRENGPTRLVHGHTHRPARHALEVDGKRCERWVLPDWYEQGGYLAIDEAGPHLVAF